MDIVVLLDTDKFYNDYPPHYKKIIKNKYDDITIDRIFSITTDEFFLIDESLDYGNFQFLQQSSTGYWGNGNCRYIRKSDKFIIKNPTALLTDKIKECSYFGESTWRNVDSLESFTYVPTIIYLNRTGKPSEWLKAYNWPEEKKIEILHSTGTHSEIYQYATKVTTEYIYIITQPIDNIPTYAPKYEHKNYICMFNNIRALRIVYLRKMEYTFDQTEWENGNINSHSIDIESVSLKPFSVSTIQKTETSDFYFYCPSITRINDSFNLTKYIPFSEQLSTRVWNRFDLSGNKIDEDGEWGLFLFHSYCNKIIKELDDKSITFAPFDVIFLSYNEPNADTKYKNLLAHCQSAKRVDKVKGIFNAHKTAAELSTTDMFFVVDADATILPSFDFINESKVRISQMNAVHVWKSINKINGLTYGYGGVKLFPRKKVLESTSWNLDFTTSISNNFILHESVSNITEFNTSKFDTWKAAFRECVKLTVFSILNKDADAANRLAIWMTKCDRSVQYADYAIYGAKDGNDYAIENIKNTKNIDKINDFEWLKDIFLQKYN